MTSRFGAGALATVVGTAALLWQAAAVGSGLCDAPAVEDGSSQRPWESTDNLQLLQVGRRQLGAAAGSRRSGVQPQPDKAARARVLYLMYSDSTFYDSRVRWIHDTWAQLVPPGMLLVVGDKAGQVGGLNITGTDCLAHSHANGLCCKWATAVVLGAERVRQDPSIEWVFIMDDDVYLRPDELERSLARQQPASSPIVLATLGCATDHCSGICGGGGYAINPEAIRAVGAHDPASYYRDTEAACSSCDEWGDMSLSEVYKQHGVKLQTLDGLYAWKTHRDEFLITLAASQPPITYHYINTEPQMHMLHNLFTPAANPPQSAFEASPDLCATFRGTTSCAASAEPKDVPWNPTPSTRPSAVLQLRGLAGKRAEAL